MAIVSPNRAFNYADQLIHWFHDPGFDAALKCGVYRKLLAAGQAGSSSELPKALVVLGLWPGLDNARRRVRMKLREEGRAHIDADEVTNALHDAMEFQLADRNFAAVPNPAGAFVGRVRGAALHALRGGRQGMRRHLQIDDLGLYQPHAGFAEIDDQDELLAIRKRLEAVLTPLNIDLLIADKVECLTSREAAGRFRLSPDAVRTRISASLKTVRERLPDLASHFGLEPSPFEVGGSADNKEPEHA